MRDGVEVMGGVKRCSAVTTSSHPSLPTAPRQPSAANPQQISPQLDPIDNALPFPPPSLPPPPPDTPPASATEPTAHDRVRIELHPVLDSMRCDANGYDLPPGAPPPPLDEHAKNDWGSFNTRVQFKFAEFIYKRQEMAGDSIDQLAQFLAALYLPEDPFFNNHHHLYAMIDEIQQGDIPWQSFSVQYTGPCPETGKIPSWMTQTYEVWAPKHGFKDGKRQFTDLMSGNWAWRQAASTSASFYDLS
ncbi:C2H2-type domain-containing protein [Mycena indigotica]|uniref:C2H2-type domain-containing protein n=1 Tax=Mycena indigotica TaxID=2126181 RepID=A0A8H6SCM8_9AGAR|nr:C2H2-type domain-containing protein [Mycena indigotica]KAF7296974.1 C2H2-type domain-containing protein [Mycena indigotica]